jgi:hypothetical protein
VKLAPPGDSVIVASGEPPVTLIDVLLPVHIVAVPVTVAVGTTAVAVTLVRFISGRVPLAVVFI